MCKGRLEFLINELSKKDSQYNEIKMKQEYVKTVNQLYDMGYQKSADFFTYKLGEIAFNKR